MNDPMPTEGEHLVSCVGAKPLYKSLLTAIPSLVLQFRQVHGRTFTSQSDEYFLPADDEEHVRLDLQHNLLKYHLGALYPCSAQVEWLLRSDQETRPGVLDVGTGSGSW